MRTTGPFFMSDANPILAEQTRGNFVENRHRGAFVVADADGRIIASAGDIARPVFPRSAIKSMQALAMLTSGSIGKFELTDEELALACASHTGEDYHVAGVTHFLGHIGLEFFAVEESGEFRPNFHWRRCLFLVLLYLSLSSGASVGLGFGEKD
jgi:L-asparaginase II